MTKKTTEEVQQQGQLMPAPEYTKYSRNDAGLLNNVEYKFNENRSIDWRAMIDPKYIVLNKDKAAAITEKYSTTLKELQDKIQNKEIDERDVEDGFKLILLAGMKEIAKLRGYTCVDHQVNNAGPEFVGVKTTISWIPNFETDNKFISFSALADAHLGNTTGFGNKVLSTIAENRGFVRCVRNFLGIHICGSDEMGTLTEETQEFTPKHSATGPNAAVKAKFQALQDEFKVSWGAFTKFATKNGLEQAIEWENVDSVPSENAYEVLGLIQKAVEKKRAEKV